MPADRTEAAGAGATARAARRQPTAPAGPDLGEAVGAGAGRMPDDGPVDLAALGWGPDFAAAFDRLDDRRGLTPARVGIEHNHVYRVLTAEGERLAQTAGRLRHRAAGPDDLPAVGDWVAIRLAGSDAGRDAAATIRAILPRRTAFARKAAGDPTTRQVVAANIDAALIVTGLDGGFNLRRIERYLVAVADSGAQPVVVLNKIDRCDDAAACVAAVRRAAPETPVHATCGLTGSGLAGIARLLAPGRTVTLLGPSGAGKSTIVNRLLGAARQRTQAVRAADRRGRHTTIHRELILAPAGGVLIDTPGLRALQAWDRDRALETAFAEIDALADACRFRNCRHGDEPDCAVRAAVAAGRLPAARLDHFRRLADERVRLDRQRGERPDRAPRAGRPRGPTAPRRTRRISSSH